MTKLSYILVVGVTLLAVITLVLQTAIDVQNGDKVLNAFWSQIRYFTNIMVYWVAIVFALMSIKRHWINQSLLAGTTVWIVLVGIVYHVLIAADHNPEGLDVLVNISQHTAIPIAVFLVWFFTAPKENLTYWGPVYWLACPALYVFYALVRGGIDGKYPYFFLNPDKIGWSGVLVYFLGLGLVFYLSGLAITYLAKRKAG